MWAADNIFRFPNGVQGFRSLFNSPLHKERRQHTGIGEKKTIGMQTAIKKCHKCGSQEPKGLKELRWASCFWAAKWPISSLWTTEDQKLKSCLGLVTQKWRKTGNENWEAYFYCTSVWKTSQWVNWMDNISGWVSLRSNAEKACAETKSFHRCWWLMGSVQSAPGIST